MSMSNHNPMTEETPVEPYSFDGETEAFEAPTRDSIHSVCVELLALILGGSVSINGRPLSSNSQAMAFVLVSMVEAIIATAPPAVVDGITQLAASRSLPALAAIHKAMEQ